MLDNAAARWVILHMLNGEAFYAAMALLTCAAVMRWMIDAPLRWLKMVGRPVAALGVLLLALTASFLGFWWLLFLIVLAFFAVFGRRFRRYWRGHLAGVAFIAWIGLFTYEQIGYSVPDDQPRPIVVYGDSLSAPYGIAAERTWPGIVGERTGRPVDNRAVPGSGVADALALQKRDPVRDATVLVLIGGNDQLGGTSWADYRRDLGALIDDLLDRGNAVLVIEPPVIPTRPWFGWTGDHHYDNAERLPRRIVADAIFGGPGRSRDGLHLTEAGHMALAENILKYLTLP